MELQRRRGNILKIPLLIVIGLLVAALAVVFGLFHVRIADVTGNEFYSAQEIQKMVMSDSLGENTLYLLWKYSNPEAARSLPFLSDVEIEMISPYHVQIKVFEKAIAGYLMDSGTRVYFDTDGMVVEISGEERAGIPPFSGIAISEPVVGKPLPVEDEDFLAFIEEASHLIQQSGLQPDEVHFDDKQELMLYFGARRVMLGGSSYLEEKLMELVNIYPKMEGLSGTLHMENYTPDTTAISFKKGERGEEELVIDLNKPEDEDAQEDATEEQTEEMNTAGSGYVENDSRFSTDAQGNQIYTDDAGNVTTNLDKPYLGEDGNIITDGYGYIDPYTGAYILN